MQTLSLKNLIQILVSATFVAVLVIPFVQPMRIEAVSLAASNSALTQTQVEAIISLLRSFGADETIISNVNQSLGGAPTTTTTPPATTPSITVTAPNGGEQWEIGQLNTITWAPYSYTSTVENGASDVTVMLEKKCVTGDIDVQCEKDGFRTIGKVMDQGKASLHTYFNLDSYTKWAEAGMYFVRAINNKTGAVDRSDAAFTLLPRGVDLKINGSDGPVTLTDNQPIIVTTQLGKTFESCVLVGVRETIGGPNDIQIGNKYPLGSPIKGYAYAPATGAGSYTSIYMTCRAADGTQRSDSVSVIIAGGNTTPASLRVTSPNGGESISVSDATQIKIGWFMNAIATPISIALYKDEKWLMWIEKELSLDKSLDGMYWYTWSPNAKGPVLPVLNAGNNPGYKIYITGKKADGTGYMDDKSDAPFSFQVGTTTTPIPTTATYRGYLNGLLFITTNNVTESYALENCKKNAVSNPTKSIRCTWGDKEIYNSSPGISAQTNPVVINSFTASSQNSVTGKSITFNWSSNLSPTDISTYSGGCSIEGLTKNNVAINVTNGFKPGSGSLTYVATETATYTLFCTSGGKDGSPSAKKVITVEAGPNAILACNISYSPSPVVVGGSLSISWSATNATARTYTLMRSDGSVVAGPYAAELNGSLNIASFTDLPVGNYIRKDTVTGPQGTATCNAALQVVSVLAPTCTTSYGSGNITLGQDLTVTWAATNATSRSYSLYRADGSYVFGPATVSVNGSLPAVAFNDLSVGAYVRQDVVTGPGGTATCSVPFQVNKPIAQPMSAAPSSWSIKQVLYSVSEVAKSFGSNQAASVLRALSQ